MDQEENQYYSRQLVLQDIGSEGQRKLRNSAVLVVGAGGLGSPVLQYLAGAGVGTIGIVDGDRVGISNLHRQLIYTIEDVGLSKAYCAAKRLLFSNPYIAVNAHEEYLTTENVETFFSAYDIIVDCTDNYPARYLINDGCVLYRKPWVSASIYKFEGQLSVFNVENGPTYRCLFPEIPTGDSAVNCAEVGVLGVLPGILGTLQANEVLKWILGKGVLLNGKVLTFHAMQGQFTEFQLQRAANATEIPLNSLGKLAAENYAVHCSSIVETLPADVLRDCIDHPDWLLVDVRELHEQPRFFANNLILLPLSACEEELTHLPGNKSLLVFCASGIRSDKAVRIIKQKRNIEKVFSLAGGLNSKVLKLWKQLK